MDWVGDLRTDTTIIRSRCKAALCRGTHLDAFLRNTLLVIHCMLDWRMPNRLCFYRPELH